MVFSTVKSKDFFVKPEVSLEDKVYLKTYYHHNQHDIQVNKTSEKIHVQNLQIVGWNFIEEQQFVKLNLGTTENPYDIKVNAQLIKEKIEEL